MPNQTYTREQRIAAMRAAGFPESEIATGVAISLAESWDGLGIADVPNPAPGNLPEYSVGPWQINLLAHPDITEAQALDLNYSTQYAYHMWKRQGWQPWGAYTSGSYLKFLDTNTSTTTSTNEPKDTAPVDLTSASKGTTTNNVSATIAGFKFPTLGVGPLQLDSSVLFKIAVTLGALFLIMFAIIQLTASAGPKVEVTE